MIATGTAPNSGVLVPSNQEGAELAKDLPRTYLSSKFDSTATRYDQQQAKIIHYEAKESRCKAKKV